MSVGVQTIVRHFSIVLRTRQGADSGSAARRGLSESIKRKCLGLQACETPKNWSAGVMPCDRPKDRTLTLSIRRAKSSVRRGHIGV